MAMYIAQFPVAANLVLMGNLKSIFLHVGGSKRVADGHISYCETRIIRGGVGQINPESSVSCTGEDTMGADFLSRGLKACIAHETMQERDQHVMSVDSVATLAVLQVASFGLKGSVAVAFGGEDVGWGKTKPSAQTDLEWLIINVKKQVGGDGPQRGRGFRVRNSLALIRGGLAQLVGSTLNENGLKMASEREERNMTWRRGEVRVRPRPPIRRGREAWVQLSSVILLTPRIFKRLARIRVS